MTKPDDPAYGTPIMGEKENGSAYVYSYGGLTKREYFAVRAMQGLIAGSEGKTLWSEKQFAICAINLADALIAELTKEKR